LARDLPWDGKEEIKRTRSFTEFARSFTEEWGGRSLSGALWGVILTFGHGLLGALKKALLNRLMVAEFDHIIWSRTVLRTRAGTVATAAPVSGFWPARGMSRSPSPAAGKRASIQC
jgi:hypothetical protein